MDTSITHPDLETFLWKPRAHSYPIPQLFLLNDMYQRSSIIPRLLGRTRLSSGTDLQDPSYFFRYTAGRWFDNEASEQQLRYLSFDVDGLKAAAVAAVEGAKSVVHMTKLPEGSYSKAFSIMLDNRKEIIARLPTSHAGPAHYVTASEVATMEFARRNLGLPVPRVLSWCSKRDSTAVGAEFIIMEKASGIEVSKLWSQLSEEHKLLLIDEIVKIERTALEYPLPSYGSIFFRRDLRPEMASVVDETFAIGPTLERSFWSAEREAMGIDRGPWSTPTAYLSALCRREQQWIQTHASSQVVRPFRNHPPITREPAAHLAVLDLFHSVIPNIVPFGSPKLIQPTLWHHDLSGSNIFISDTELAEGRISITSVIDWQNTCVGPLYMQARVPRLFRYHAPWDLPEGLQIALLPEGVQQMSLSDQKTAKDDVAAKNMVIYYRSVVTRHAPYYYHALTDAYNTLFAALATGASLSWDGMFHVLRDKLITLQSVWTRYTAAPCPFRISDDEIRTWRMEAQQWQDRKDEIHEIRECIGMDAESWVPAEDFKATYLRYKKARKEWISSGGTETDWPFSGPVVDEGGKEEEDSLTRTIRRFFDS